MKLNLSVITVTFNSQNFIKDYLDSLQSYLPEKSEIIIIDNNSMDNTLSILGKNDKIKLIKNKQNLGFAKASNQGAKKALGEHLLFLNPDTVVLSDSINKLLNYIKLHPEVGLVAPKLITLAGQTQESVRKFPTITGVIQEFYLHQSQAFNQYSPKGESPVEVEAVYGAIILIKKELFEKLNGFDEKFFMYFEDIDLCKRLKDQGLKIVYFPQARFKHLVGASTTKGQELGWGLRTLSLFFPFKNTGSKYLQWQSENIYHGQFKAFIIRLLIYLSIKLGFSK